MEPTVLISTLDHFITNIIPQYFAPAIGTLAPSIYAPASTSGSVEQSTSGSGLPSLPRFETSITNFDRVEGYNYRALQLAPRIGARRGDRRSYAGGDLRPILVNLQTTFRTNEYTDLIALTDAVFERTVGLQFVTEMRDPDDTVVLSFHNRVALDFQYTPEDTPDSGTGDGHSLQFQLALSTQTGRLVDVPSVLRLVHRNYVVSAVGMEGIDADASNLTVKDRTGNAVQVERGGVQTVVGDLTAEVEGKT